jgi:hypothetical protein
VESDSIFNATLVARKEVAYELAQMLESYYLLKLAQMLESYYLLKQAPKGTDIEKLKHLVAHIIESLSELSDYKSFIKEQFGGIAEQMCNIYEETNTFIEKNFKMTPQEFCKWMEEKNCDEDRIEKA